MNPEKLYGKTIERIDKVDWNEKTEQWEATEFASSLLLTFSDGSLARFDSTYSHAGVSIEEHP